MFALVLKPAIDGVMNGQSTNSESPMMMGQREEE
jgi:hypothetical protein